MRVAGVHALRRLYVHLDFGVCRHQHGADGNVVARAVGGQQQVFPHAQRRVCRQTHAQRVLAGGKAPPSFVARGGAQHHAQLVALRFVAQVVGLDVGVGVGVARVGHLQPRVGTPFVRRVVARLYLHRQRLVGDQDGLPRHRARCVVRVEARLAGFHEREVVVARVGARRGAQGVQALARRPAVFVERGSPVDGLEREAQVLQFQHVAVGVAHAQLPALALVSAADKLLDDFLIVVRLGIHHHGIAHFGGFQAPRIRRDGERRALPARPPHVVAAVLAPQLHGVRAGIRAVEAYALIGGRAVVAAAAVTRVEPVVQVVIGRVILLARQRGRHGRTVMIGVRHLVLLRRANQAVAQAHVRADNERAARVLVRDGRRGGTGGMSGVRARLADEAHLLGRHAFDHHGFLVRQILRRHQHLGRAGNGSGFGVRVHGVLGKLRVVVGHHPVGAVRAGVLARARPLRADVVAALGVVVVRRWAVGLAERVRRHVGARRGHQHFRVPPIHRHAGAHQHLAGVLRVAARRDARHADGCRAACRGKPVAVAVGNGDADGQFVLGHVIAVLAPILVVHREGAGVAANGPVHLVLGVATAAIGQVFVIRPIRVHHAGMVGFRVRADDRGHHVGHAAVQLPVRADEPVGGVILHAVAALPQLGIVQRGIAQVEPAADVVAACGNHGVVQLEDRAGAAFVVAQVGHVHVRDQGIVRTALVERAVHGDACVAFRGGLAVARHAMREIHRAKRAGLVGVQRAARLHLDVHLKGVVMGVSRGVLARVFVLGGGFDGQVGDRQRAAGIHEEQGLHVHAGGGFLRARRVDARLERAVHQRELSVPADGLRAHGAQVERVAVQVEREVQVGIHRAVPAAGGHGAVFHVRGIAHQRDRGGEARVRKGGFGVRAIRTRNGLVLFRKFGVSRRAVVEPAGVDGHVGRDDLAAAAVRVHRLLRVHVQADVARLEVTAHQHVGGRGLVGKRRAAIRRGGGAGFEIGGVDVALRHQRGHARGVVGVAFRARYQARVLVHHGRRGQAPIGARGGVHRTRDHVVARIRVLQLPEPVLAVKAHLLVHLELAQAVLFLVIAAVRLGGNDDGLVEAHVVVRVVVCRVFKVHRAVLHGVPVAVLQRDRVVRVAELRQQVHVRSHGDGGAHGVHESLVGVVRQRAAVGRAHVAPRAVFVLRDDYPARQALAFGSRESLERVQVRQRGRGVRAVVLLRLVRLQPVVAFQTLHAVVEGEGVGVDLHDALVGGVLPQRQPLGVHHEPVCDDPLRGVGALRPNEVGAHGGFVAVQRHGVRLRVHVARRVVRGVPVARGHIQKRAGRQVDAVGVVHIARAGKREPAGSGAAGTAADAGARRRLHIRARSLGAGRVARNGARRQREGRAHVHERAAAAVRGHVRRQHRRRLGCLRLAADDEDAAAVVRRRVLADFVGEREAAVRGGHRNAATAAVLARAVALQRDARCGVGGAGNVQAAAIRARHVGGHAARLHVQAAGMHARGGIGVGIASVAGAAAKGALEAGTRERGHVGGMPRFEGVAAHGGVRHTRRRKAARRRLRDAAAVVLRPVARDGSAGHDDLVRGRFRASICAAHEQAAARPGGVGRCGRRGGRAFRVSRNGQVVFRAAARARHRRVAGNGAARKPHDALTHVRQRAVFAPVAGDGAARHVQGAHVVDGARAAVVLRLPPVAGVEALHLRAGGAAVAAVAVARHGARVALDGAAAQVQRARVVDGARHRRHAACDGHAVVHGERAALQNLDGAGVQLGVVGVVLDGDAAVQREFAVRTHLEERALGGAGQVAVKREAARAHAQLAHLADGQAAFAGDHHGGCAGRLVGAGGASGGVAALARIAQVERVGERDRVVVAHVVGVVGQQGVGCVIAVLRGDKAVGVGIGVGFHRVVALGSAVVVRTHIGKEFACHHVVAGGVFQIARLVRAGTRKRRVASCRAGAFRHQRHMLAGDLRHGVHGGVVEDVQRVAIRRLGKRLVQAGVHAVVLLGNPVAARHRHRRAVADGVQRRVRELLEFEDAGVGGA